ncbi:hypothetical protein EXIGLDRAFT_831364 [Exidia glandulosa HHB12029]|uniref:Uncharacterized protein n=1 Tax=Exidia glandulosa HHB12029 TaxID=1314781 RepID=A0A165MQY4_EXIGL|nr:hypothetical protein EXIGLDRAFT_831364 [Exidia glandulosa HHB12029]
MSTNVVQASVPADLWTPVPPALTTIDPLRSEIAACLSDDLTGDGSLAQPYELRPFNLTTLHFESNATHEFTALHLRGVAYGGTHQFGNQTVTGSLPPDPPGMKFDDEFFAASTWNSPNPDCAAWSYDLNVVRNRNHDAGIGLSFNSRKSVFPFVLLVMVAQADVQVTGGQDSSSTTSTSTTTTSTSTTLAEQSSTSSTSNIVSSKTASGSPSTASTGTTPDSSAPSKHRSVSGLRIVMLACFASALVVAAL